MINKYARILLISMAFLSMIYSCKRSDNSIYFYSEIRDTIAPEIIPSVPTANFNFSFGETVHIIGNVVDKETTKRGGKLKDLRIKLLQYKPSNDSVLKVFKEFVLDVDGKEAFTYNVQYDIPPQGSTIYGKVIITTTDYSTRTDIDSTLFTMQ